MKAIYDALGHESDAGRNLLGALAIRFCPPSSAHLAMNIHPMTCFIEMPSIRSPDVASVYARCWAELESAGVPFTCHWGQVHGLTPARVSSYFGDRDGRRPGRSSFRTSSRATSSRRPSSRTRG